MHPFYILLINIVFIYFSYILTKKIIHFYKKRKEKKIIKQCIIAYEGIITDLPYHEHEWLEFLRNVNMHYGLCNYLWCRERAGISTNIDWEYRKWVKKVPITWGSGFWYKTPSACDTLKEAIECLQYRIDKMKTLL